MSGHGARALAFVIAAGLPWLAAAPAMAATRLYVIAVGNNELPAAAGAGDGLKRLRYADDDATAVVALAEELGARTTLLTVMDADTRRLFPAQIARALPPTLAELRRAVAWHRARLEADRRAGDEPVVILFFSGHGQLPKDGAPALALLDGPLTRQVLYDEILAALPARYLHVIVDACHAEAVVRARDVDLPTVPVTAGDVRAVVERTTLARFPQVGAIVATSAAGESHEWDRLQHGVFTFEVLSALRGAADVNGDGRIEYSEVSAFIAAANHDVDSPRARQDVQVHPPTVNPRAALVDLGPAVGAGRLSNTDGGGPSALQVEDERGEPLLSFHAEAAARFSLLVPTGRELYVTAPDGREARVRLEPGQTLAGSALTWSAPDTRARGSLASSLDRGLFAMAFGPAYYRGFVDGQPELMAVPLGSGQPEDRQSPGDARPRMTRGARAAFVGAAVLAAASLGFTGAALLSRHDYDETPYQRPAADALARMRWERSVAIAAGVAAAASAGLGLYLGWRSGARIAAGAGGGAALVSLAWDAW